MHSLARILGKSALVVKEVQLDETAEQQLKIVARKAGVISWILSLVGIDSTFTLLIYKDRLESVEGSLSGHIRTIIPMTALDTYMCGFTKPIQNLVIAVVLVIFALVSSFNGMPGFVVFIMLAIAVGSCIAYYLGKCLLLNFTTNGANGILFLFKRSVIEGVNIDETFSERVCEMVKLDYIEQAKK